MFVNTWFCVRRARASVLAACGIRAGLDAAQTRTAAANDSPLPEFDREVNWSSRSLRAGNMNGIIRSRQLPAYIKPDRIFWSPLYAVS